MGCCCVVVFVCVCLNVFVSVVLGIIVRCCMVWELLIVYFMFVCFRFELCVICL